MKTARLTSLLRLLAIVIPVGSLVVILYAVETMFSGSLAYLVSKDNDDWSQWLIVFPAVLALLCAWKFPSNGLIYLTLVDVLVFIPVAFQTFLMIGNEHAHPWLGLTGIWQLILLFVAAVVGFVGRWLWSLK